MSPRFVWLLPLAACFESGDADPAPVAEPAPDVEPADPRVTKAAAVANAIALGTDPADAMAAEGLDPKGFRELLYEIAGDAKLSKAYEAARK